MPNRLVYEQLKVVHLDELASVLRHPLVHEHIGTSVPELESFKIDLQRHVAGPPPGCKDQIWLNYLVSTTDCAMIGRLEATIHDSIAEVAFLIGPAYWGLGYASEALVWLHSQIAQRADCTSFWATTVPDNELCQALLRRNGYVQVDGPYPVLHSYDAGELEFRHDAAPNCTSD